MPTGKFASRESILANIIYRTFCKLKDGRLSISADLMPAFMYQDPDSYNRLQPYEGFARGHILIRVSFILSH